MKYLDADKLKAKIEKFSATEYGGNTLGDDVANGALNYVLEEIIPSLQQEQLEADLEKEIKYYFMDSGYNLSSYECYEIACHFAEWGAIHLNAREEE